MKSSDLTALRSRKELFKFTPDLTVNLLRVHDLAGAGFQSCAGASDPLAGVVCQPDMFKAYADFQICHSFPQIIGPTGSGAFMGFHPAVLADNHTSLLHQWMNLRHLVKVDDPTQRDRIVGCIIATSFPSTPPQGWSISDDPASVPFITARCVLFKQADGMNKVLGDHQTSRANWKVSIEVDAGLDNIGIYLPSTKEIFSFEQAPEDLLDVVSIDKETGSLLIGKARGQQLAFAYGKTRGKVNFRGVGMTTNPAEKTAKIVSIKAEGSDEQLFRIAAEGKEEELLVGSRCSWNGGMFSGKIAEVKMAGKLPHPHHPWHLTASENDPALKIYLAGGQVVLKHFSAVKLAA